MIMTRYALDRFPSEGRERRKAKTTLGRVELGAGPIKRRQSAGHSQARVSCERSALSRWCRLAGNLAAVVVVVVDASCRLNYAHFQSGERRKQRAAARARFGFSARSAET